MSRKKIFISSTCLDLIDVRAELKATLEQQGYIAYTSESHDFPVNTKLSPVDNCLDVVKQCDVYILVIHTRYGSRYTGTFEVPAIPKDPPGGFVSITLAEFTAKAAGLETRIWVRDFIWSTNPRFRGGHDTSADRASLPSGVDPTVYDFLNYVDNPHHGGSWINQFHDVTDLRSSLTNWLRQRNYETGAEFARVTAELLLELQGFCFDRGRSSRPRAGQAPCPATRRSIPRPIRNLDLLPPARNSRDSRRLEATVAPDPRRPRRRNL